MKKTFTLSMLMLISFFSNAIESSITSSELSFVSSNSDSIVITISGPDQFNKQFSVAGNYLSINTTEINDQKDGNYNFEVISTEQLGSTITNDSNGRDQAVKNLVNSESLAGHFRIQNGLFVINSEEE